MPFYEASVQITTQSTAPFVVAALRGPTNARATLYELEVFTLTSPTTSLQLALVRSTALGTGTLTGMTGLGRDPDNTGAGGQLISGFATARPTIGATTTYQKRIVFPAALGAGIMRSFDLAHPLVLPLGSAANGDLCIVQTTATASGDLVINASWAE